MRIKIKYRNTGFMRQVFVWFKYRGQWRYKGIEFNKSYFRVYKLTDEGVIPRFRDLFGATASQERNE
jgi:hypothetical protein